MKMLTFLTIALVVLGIYVLPSVTARFAGTHTQEWDAATGTKGMQCTACHEYIMDELMQSYANAFNAHKNASLNITYTNNWIHVGNLSNETNLSLCFLCHLAQFNVTHTKTTLRACTDINCHGDNVTTNNTLYVVGTIGMKLGNSANVHRNWFVGMSNYDSKYANESGKNYTKGFYVCLGCHTDVGVVATVIKGAYNHTNPSFPQRRYI